MILACPAAAGKTEVRTPASKSGTRCPSCGAWVRSRSTAARTSSGPPRACCGRGRTGRGPAGARCSTQRAYRRHALNGGAKVRDQGLAEGVALLSTCLSRSRYRVSRALVGLNLLFFDDLVAVVALRLGRLFPSRRSHLVGRLDRIVLPAGSRRRRWGRLSSSKKPRRRRSAWPNSCIHLVGSAQHAGRIKVYPAIVDASVVTSDADPAWNDNPRPFMWTKTAQQILGSLARLLQGTTGAEY